MLVRAAAFGRNSGRSAVVARVASSSLRSLRRLWKGAYFAGPSPPVWMNGASPAASAADIASSSPSSSLRWHSTATATATADAGASTLHQHHPELTRVPSLPYVGSMIPFHSGVPSDPRRPYTFWPEMRRRFGDFYVMGFPVMGDPNDKFSTVYVVHDPNEMIKVVRSEGIYPSGLLQRLWPNRRYTSLAGFVTGGDGDEEGFSGQGPGWKRLRGFLQTDLLHPEAARGYVPGMVEAARLASRGAPASSEEGALLPYFNRCAFDLFNTIMFGVLTRTADPDGPREKENLDFVTAATSGMSASIQQLANPYELIVGKALGLETDQYRKMSEGYETTWRICQAKIERFKRLKGEGKLDANQSTSYLARAMDRQASQEDNKDGITVREMEELVFSGLFAAVDTTSSTLAWNLLHVALNPDVQERLHDELSRNLEELGDDDDEDGGRRLNAAVLDRAASPYLHAVVRESHRITPIGAFSVFKRVGSDNGMDVHGVHLPKGAVVALCSHPLMRDPSLVDDPDQFIPERWYPDAMEGRKGTPSEIIDHPYFRDAFSQGPRKCPASRVAANEILVMIAQLVLDYRISAPEGVDSLGDVDYEIQTTTQPIMPNLRFEKRGGGQ